ncbi:MAG TPA: serine hydrolase [Gemmatimonadales bacterium]|nr:serine hydrolase [Gemmatimonadales bacterium]
MKRRQSRTADPMNAAGAILRIATLAVLASPVAACGQQLPAIERIEQRLMPRIVIRGEPPVTRSLSDRMTHYRIPAVSIAVMNGGKIEWARAWGMADVADNRAATPATLFQAASISKPVAATAALVLTERGMLDLDADVNRYLRSWKLPPGEALGGDSVTVRRLMSHSAGLTVHGFPGYARSATIPSTAGVLDGQGNTDPVRVDLKPGTQWRYSGGGYTVLQMLLADLTGKPFAQLMRELVLQPAGMASSTYEQPLPEARWREAATGYRDDGRPVEENWHVYPEQAAAGLWTTPTDLAKWGLAILAAADGAEGGPLSPDMARRMLEPGLNHQGLGPAIGPMGRFFGHGGSNEGFRCQLVVFRDGRGAAVMTNSDRGGALVPEILATLAEEYGWPDFKAVERPVAAVPVERLAALAGTYRVEGQPPDLVITVDGGRVYAEAAGVLRRTELLTESDTVLFTRDEGITFQFEREGDRVTAVRVMGRRAIRLP